LVGTGWPSISVGTGQLLPVSGTPQAKAASSTPGIAETRSSARRWKPTQSSCTVVTVIERMWLVL
jgi:hypothetical protein